MTNEEKTNEYIENLLCKNFDNDGTSLYTEDEIKKAILYGLAEGEKIGKEKQWVASEKAQKKTSKRIRELEKENAELKAKISVLLSCKNCPENNKGGYICVKEYNDQCLAQKIQYIKELEEEIEELKEQIKD